MYLSVLYKQRLTWAIWLAYPWWVAQPPKGGQPAVVQLILQGLKPSFTSLQTVSLATG